MSRKLALVALLVLPACGSSEHRGPVAFEDHTRIAPPADPTVGLDGAYLIPPLNIEHKPPRHPARRYQRHAYGGDLPPGSVQTCESHGDYQAENPESSASGGWQITDGTWDGYGGYSHAADAPREVQDEKARLLWAGGRGAGHWSACL